MSVWDSDCVEVASSGTMRETQPEMTMKTRIPHAGSILRIPRNIKTARGLRGDMGGVLLWEAVSMSDGVRTSGRALGSSERGFRMATPFRGGYKRE